MSSSPAEVCHRSAGRVTRKWPTKTHRLALLCGAALLLLLAACAPGANDQAEVVKAPGFWLGLWHGLIAPVTFVISLFSTHVGMYEVHNNGGWYDFGFLLGLGLWHGGGAAGRRRRRAARDKGF